MMIGGGGPPDLLLRLLEAALPPGVVGRSIAGDVVEEWHRRPEGPRRLAWFIVVATGLAFRYLMARAATATAESRTVAVDALRRSLRRPVASALTVLALGLGIAAPATMYSIVQVLTRDVDVEEPERLVHIGRRFSPTVVGIAPLEWLWPGVSGIDELEAVGVYSRERVDLSGEAGHAERLQMAEVGPGVFRAFGVDAALGRTFGEEGRGAPVVLGHDLWRSRFGGDPGVLGRTVRVDGVPRTVVGVMPDGFAYPGGVDLWAPLDLSDPALREVADFQAVGRLAPGASIEAVRSRVGALEAALVERGEEIPPGGGLVAQSWSHHLIAPRDRRMLSVMVVLVGFVLVIACADVLNLLLVRALARSRETAVRVALGAGRGRIVGEHLAEVGLLAALAGLLALGLTMGAVRAFEVATAGQLAHWMEVRLEPSALLFGAALVALAALGAGIVPALQSGRIDPGVALRDGGRGASAFRIGRISRLVVAAEIALSCALLVVAGIMVRGAVSTLRTDGEYATRSVLTARYELRPGAYDDDGAQGFHRALVQRLEDHPGVARAALTTHLPGVFSGRRRVEVAGRDAASLEELPITHRVAVSPSYPAVLESRVLRGRDFTWDDASGGDPPVLVNEAFVREHLEGRDPIGARLRMRGPGDAGDATPWARVVGVVPPLGIDVGRDDDATGVYTLVTADPVREVAVLVRAAGGTDPLSLVPELREIVGGMDADLALWSVDTLAGHIEATRAIESVFALLFLAFGGTGLLLATVGLYGLLAFGVRRRVRELGVRMALGAAPVRVVWTALGSGLLHLVAGLAAGLLLAALVAPLLGQALFGMDPRDPSVYGAVAGVLALTGVVASLVPARRALGVQVMEALRTE